MKKALSYVLTLALGLCLGLGALSLVTRADGTDKTAMPTNDPIYINGQKTEVEVYKIDGNNYFKLRDLGRALDFYVGWSQEQGVSIESGRPYVEEGEEEAAATPAPTPLMDSSAPDLFDQLDGKSFTFASGAGGWSTSLTFGRNGSFTGSFHDSNMGETGTGYPNGTLYVCNFGGSFADAEQVDDDTWCVRLREITLARTPEESEIIDGVQYIYSTPYGLDDGDLFYIYLPGRSTAGLPEEFIRWVAMPNSWNPDAPPAELPFWGLYNVGGEMGFFSD